MPSPTQPDLVRPASPLAGRYRIERELGRGGMAVVYLATDLKQQRQVAVKVLRPEVAMAVGPERFAREIETAARLNHPHLLPLFDSGQTEGSSPLPFYVMPYLEGESLRQRLEREGPLPVDEAVRIAREVADALGYAHERGVVHRDIKPENVLLSSGAAVVADFGIVRAIADAAGARLTETGLALGTPQYMSPEQALGGRDLDGRTDVYSLGVVLYEMLAGEPPFRGPSAQAIAARALTDPLPPLTTIRHLPPALDAAVSKALEKAPADRYPTAAAFARALAELPVSPAPSVNARRSRRPAFVAGAVVLVLAAAVALTRVLKDESPPLDRSLLVVVPFDATVTDRDLEIWREGITDVVSRNLDGVGSLRSVAPSRVVRAWSSRGGGDRAAAAIIGRRTGAGLAVFGRVLSLGSDSVRLVASVLDVTEDRVLVEADVRDGGARIDRAIDSLSITLIRELARDREIGPVRLASIGSRSLPAIRAFIRGEAFFRRTAWDSALTHFRRAAELDSTFALAFSRTGQVLGWQRLAEDRLSHEQLLRAAGLNRGLGFRDSVLIVADSLFAALYQIDDPLTRWRMTHRLVATLRDASERYADDPEVWRGLGEADFHWGLDVGGSAAGTIAAFQRSVALDSTFGPAYIHLVPLVGRFEGPEVARRIALRYLALQPTDADAEAIALAARLLDPAEPDTLGLRQVLDTSRAPVLFEAWAATHPIPDSAEVGIEVGRRLLRSERGLTGPLSDEANRRRFFVTVVAYRGHLREAMAAAGAGSRDALLTELTLVPNPPEPAGRLLAAAPPLSITGLEWARARGDQATLQRIATLGGDRRQAPADIQLRYLAMAARGYLAILRGDSATGVQLLRAAPDSGCECYLHRLHLARVLIARGDLDEARNVLSREMEKLYGGPLSQVLWELERGRLAEREGRRDAARRSYQFVRDVWRRADPELRDFVAAATAGLQRLGPGS